MPPTATLPSAADAFTALSGYTAPSAADVLTQADNKYGVNDLQTRVQNLRALTGNLTNAIAAVDPSVTARTAGSLVNEGQRSALVAREQAPLQSNLSSENTTLENANSDLSTAQGNAKDEAAAESADNSAKYQKLLDTYNIANAREAAQAQTQAEAAQQAEAVRQFNVGEQDKAADRSASATSASQLSPAQTLTLASQHVGSQLSSLTGKDGFVSNGTWSGALNDFVSAGGTTRQFFQKYSQYVNPKYKTSYAGWSDR